mgnify:FL=1
MLNNNPECKLYKKIKHSGKITDYDVEKYRDKNRLTWHEENDMVHMNLVSEDVNHVFGHLGGVSEAKQKAQGREYRTQQEQKNRENCKKN